MRRSLASWPGRTVAKALLIAALALCFAGCAVVQPDTTVRSSPTPPPATNSLPTVAGLVKQPEVAANPAPPAPQPLPRAGEPPRTPPPIASKGAERLTAAKGAEKLAAPPVPAVVRAREKPAIKGADQVQPKGPMIADAGALTDAPVKELVFKGSPAPQPGTGLSVRKLLIWIGVGLIVGSLAITLRLCLIRRAEPIKVAGNKNEDVMPLPGLLFKESVESPPEALVVEKP